MTRSTTAINQQKAEKAFNQVRDELNNLGLLADGKYLDQIELAFSALPSIWGEAGYVFDERVPLLAKAVGYKEGVIYLPRNIPHSVYVPGNTIVDIIRHEFGHAWAWLDRDFIDGDWFAKAFGGPYGSVRVFENNVYRIFSRMTHPITGTPVGGWHFEHYGFSTDFLSPYAMKACFEDMAETFMHYLRHRNSLERFRKRKGVYRKLKAVENAVRRKAKQLKL